MTISKIRITDDVELREELDREYESSSRIQLCKYALSLATHVLESIRYSDDETIKEAFRISEQWQKGDVSMREVRQAAFQIHQMAKVSGDTITASALRTVGHAVATAHMKEHAMVASDYAVRVINLLYPGNMESVKKERLWQINRLREIKYLN
ncbi:MAG: hypothetical protein IJI44_08040 [Erysipelotrichaceae bacterium]|nr:hypothetical protein [Erysipelotrichaceae bacterium]